MIGCSLYGESLSLKALSGGYPDTLGDDAVEELERTVAPLSQALANRTWCSLGRVSQLNRPGSRGRRFFSSFLFRNGHMLCSLYLCFVLTHFKCP